MRYMLLCMFSMLVITQTAAAQDDAAMYQELFGAAFEAGELGDEAVSTAAEAVWGASEFNGGTLTLSGTLTQTGPDSDVWTYSASPADRLVVAYYGGPSFDFIFARFDGYLDGTWEDFYDQHDVDFTVSSMGQDLRVVSFSHFTSKTSGKTTHADEWTIERQRTLTGTISYVGEPLTIDLIDVGSENGYVENGFASLTTNDDYSGTASSGSTNYTISQTAWVSISDNSNAAVHAKNVDFRNNSSGVRNGITYAFQDAHAAWAVGSVLNDPGAFDVVTDPGYWTASGLLLRDGVVYGAVAFDGPVNEYGPGPNLVLQIAGSPDIIINGLNNKIVTGLESADGSLALFELGRNFPNPFGQSTTIEYTLAQPAPVQLTVYDISGRLVESRDVGLENEGRHELVFSGLDLPGGLYFYRLKVGQAEKTRPMTVVH